jgi:hypothetical protein
MPEIVVPRAIPKLVCATKIENQRDIERRVISDKEGSEKNKLSSLGVIDKLADKFDQFGTPKGREYEWPPPGVTLFPEMFTSEKQLAATLAGERPGRYQLDYQALSPSQVVLVRDGSTTGKFSHRQKSDPYEVNGSDMTVRWVVVIARDANSSIWRNCAEQITASYFKKYEQKIESGLLPWECPSDSNSYGADADTVAFADNTGEEIAANASNEF